MKAGFRRRRWELLIFQVFGPPAIDQQPPAERSDNSDRCIAVSMRRKEWPRTKTSCMAKGNKNAVVSIYRYVSEGSFDAYMWQTLETKAKFIAQVEAVSVEENEEKNSETQNKTNAVRPEQRMKVSV
jgi:hypothetical protein